MLFVKIQKRAEHSRVLNVRIVDAVGRHGMSDLGETRNMSEMLDLGVFYFST